MAWFWGRENSWHLAYPDRDGVLYECYELSGRWYITRLADGLAIPPCAGGLAATAPGEAEHVIYRGRDGALHALSYAGAWRHQRLDAEPGGTPAIAEAPGGRRVVAWRGEDGRVRVLAEGASGFQSAHPAGAIAVGDPHLLRDGDRLLLLAPGVDGRPIELAWADGMWR